MTQYRGNCYYFFAECPEGFVSSGIHEVNLCFAFVTQPSTWDEAAHNCEALHDGARFAIILSAKEHYSMVRHIKKLGELASTAIRLAYCDSIRLIRPIFLVVW